jgi:hypothetical protein
MVTMDPARFALIRAQLFPPETEPPSVDPDTRVRERKPFRPSGLTDAAEVEEPDEPSLTELRGVAR